MADWDWLVCVKCRIIPVSIEILGGEKAVCPKCKGTTFAINEEYYEAHKKEFSDKEKELRRMKPVARKISSCKDS